jgi:hypothetical protein
MLASLTPLGVGATIAALRLREVAMRWSLAVTSVVLLALVAQEGRAESPPAECSDCDCAAARPEMAVVSKFPRRDWKESFGRAATIVAAGEYAGTEKWQFESFSLNKLQPSPTAVAKVDETKHALLIYDPQPGLKKNPSAPPPWSPGIGAVSLTGWVNAQFSDVIVRGVVNADGAGAGESRQGLIARWDRHHNYYWFYVDFSAGKIAIAKQKVGTATALPLPGSERPIPSFNAKVPYRLEFRLVGNTLSGKILDAKGTVLAETPEVRDDAPHICGISGVNVEPSMNAPFAPLRASFGDLSSVVVKRPR